MPTEVRRVSIAHAIFSAAPRHPTRITTYSCMESAAVANANRESVCYDARPTCLRLDLDKRRHFIGAERGNCQQCDLRPTAARHNGRALAASSGTMLTELLATTTPRDPAMPTSRPASAPTGMMTFSPRP
jgi:hypothetical protein